MVLWFSPSANKNNSIIDLPLTQQWCSLSHWKLREDKEWFSYHTLRGIMYQHTITFFLLVTRSCIYLHTEMNIFLSCWQYDNLWKFNHYYVVKQSLIPFSICTFYFHFDIFEELLEELGSFLQFSSVKSLSHVWPFRPHESQHARPPCPSPTPGVHSDSRSSSQWCHPAISSSVVPFSSCPQSLPASESFTMSQLFPWILFYLYVLSHVPHLWPMDCSWPCNSVHRISQARVLEWIAMSYSRGSSQPGSWTRVSCIGSQILYHYTTW